MFAIALRIVGVTRSLTPTAADRRLLDVQGLGKVAVRIDSARKGLTTETARRIAEVSVHLSPLTWRER